MKSIRTLENAIDVVYNRSIEYPNLHDNFNDIAGHWSIILGHPVSADQVVLCMIALKLSRLSRNPQHADSWVDVAGYSACGAEISGAEGE